MDTIIETKEIEIGGKKFYGLKVNLKKAPLLLIAGEKGMMMCGYLNMETAERLGEAACLVTGVKTFEDVLNSGIKEASSEAKKLGIEIGMPCRKALELLG